MFQTNHKVSLFPERDPDSALDVWRDAERLVASRWYAFLDALPENRPFAFASYVAALDAEESAARKMADLLAIEAA